MGGVIGWQWRREWKDIQFSYGELDFKIPVGFLILDGLQVLRYMSL